MQILDLKELEYWYVQNYQNQLKGLRILFEDIDSLIKNLSAEFDTQLLGTSNNEIPIFKISIGSGKKRILIWSQMHGNESTGTKAVFDFFNFISNPLTFSEIKNKIIESCTLVFIPMLNPDGAINYTRENSKGVDLNRDAVALKAKESKLLRSVLDEFKPHFCFNLHDQRTIFNVKGTKNPATISFLAPSEEVTRGITTGRTETMSAIVSMNAFLQKSIPNHVGRYTDEFYPTATGDNFQKMGFNTILIEAGHYYDDYEREITRKYNFYALLQGIHFLSISDDYSNYKPYFDIPNNDNKYFDILYKNVLINEDSMDKVVNIGVLYKYKVVDNKLVRYNSEAYLNEAISVYGYVEIDLKNKPLK